MTDDVTKTRNQAAAGHPGPRQSIAGRLAAAVVLLASTVAGAGDMPRSLRALAKVGEAIWAAGDGGTVLRSSDQGRTWSAVPGAGQVNLQAIVNDSGRAVLLGGIGIPGHPAGWGRGAILRSDASGSEVSPRPDATLGWLYGAAVRGNAALVLGQATPLYPGGAARTGSGGNRWTPVDTPDRGPFRAGLFLSPQMGWGFGPGHRILSLRQLGELLVVPDRVDSSAGLSAAALGAGGRVWAVGQNGTVVHSRATGRSWNQPRLALPAATFRLADFEAIAVDGERIWIGGGLLGVILYSDNNAARWQLRPAPGAVHALLHVGRDVLLAAGPAGSIHRSDDAGKTWKQVHGPSRLDVLIVAGPGDRAPLAIAAVTAASGARPGILWASLPRQDSYVLRDQPFRAAAVAAGAVEAVGLTELTSPTQTPAGGAMNAEQILRFWRRQIDAPADAELALQLAAAIRLYRPRVLVLPATGTDRPGPAAESALIGRIGLQALALAGREQDDRDLGRIGLAPFQPDRVLIGLEGNETWREPWRKDPRAFADLVLDTSVFPAGAASNLEMQILQAASVLPASGLPDRPAIQPAWRQHNAKGRLRLPTAGLIPSLLRQAPVDDDRRASADAVSIRMALARKNTAQAVGSVVASAARAGQDDPLPADRALLLWRQLLAEGRIEPAREVLDAYLAHGQAHPLYRKINLYVLLRWYANEYRAQLGRGHRLALRPPGDLEKAVETLGQWEHWVHLPAVAVARARILAAQGHATAAKVQREQIFAGPAPAQWKRFASWSLTGQAPAGSPVAPLLELTAETTDQPGKIDGRLDEAAWAKARPHRLRAPDGRAGPGGYDATVQLLRSPSALLVGLRLERTIAKQWQVDLAFDADGDGVTQLILSLDTRGRLQARVAHRFGPDLTVPDSVCLVRGARAEKELTVELALPLQSLGLAPAAGGSCFLQVRAVADVNPAVTRQLQPGPAGSLAPEHSAYLRYGPIAQP